MLRVKENPQALGYLPYNRKRCFLLKRPSFQIPDLDKEIRFPLLKRL